MAAIMTSDYTISSPKGARLFTSETWKGVFDRAWAGEPQFVSHGPSQTVVVISLRSYEASKPKKRRSIVKNPKLAFSISDADLFSDDSSQWEACNDEAAAA